MQSQRERKKRKSRKSQHLGGTSAFSACSARDSAHLSATLSRNTTVTNNKGHVMNDIYNLEWVEEIDGEEQISVVCSHCNSIAYIEPETGDEICPVCRRINGNIDNKYAIIECKKCGWHIAKCGIDPIFGERALECQRCYARFRVDKDGKPGGCLSRADWCPTCRQETVQAYVDDGNRLLWRCNHCKNTFRSDEDGNLILPDLCDVCGKYAVQMQYDAASKLLYKQCTECLTEYTMDNKQISNNADDEDDDIMNFNISIADERYNPLKPLKMKGE